MQHHIIIVLHVNIIINQHKQFAFAFVNSIVLIAHRIAYKYNKAKRKSQSKPSLYYDKRSRSIFLLIETFNGDVDYVNIDLFKAALLKKEFSKIIPLLNSEC